MAPAQRSVSRRLPSFGLPGLLLSLLLVPGTRALGASTAPEDEAPPDLAGTWLRDEAKSDDLREHLEVNTKGPSAGIRFGGSAFGGRGHSIPKDRRGNAKQLERYARGLEVLAIEQTDDQVTVRNANREVRVLYPDGSTFGDGLSSQTTAYYHGGELVVETQSESSVRTETFSRDGELLVVLTQIQRSEEANLEVRNIYERVGEPPHRHRKAALSDGATPRRPLGEPVPSPFAHDSDNEPAELEESAESPGDLTASTGREAPPPTFVTSEATYVGPAESRLADRPSTPQRSSVLRILPLAPQKGGHRGNTEVETLTVDPAIATVVFYLDDQEVARKSTLPYNAKIRLDDPAREQVIKVEALDTQDRRLGADEVTVNRYDPPFRIRSMELVPAEQGPRLVAEVSVPRDVALLRVDFYRNQRLFAENREPPYEALVPGPPLGARDVLRAVAVLEDGRTTEDAQVGLLPGGKAFSEEVDVRLEQVEVLVTDRSGIPISDLTADDFEIVHGGKDRAIDELRPSTEVPLLLGFAIDSSASMQPRWDATRAIAESFVDSALRPRDRAFLIDFDTHIRLLRSPTHDQNNLFNSLVRLRAGGGTALYDAILFSLLQFTGEPERRGLIVVTDGYDSESRADPKHAVDIAKRLGVPVYAIALDTGGGAALPSVGQFPGAGGSSFNANAVRGNLRLITDPSGGHYFDAVSGSQVAKALDRIEQELRQQYVLSFYTDVPAEALEEPEVRVTRPHARVRSVLPLEPTH